jgi:hypothetical protein
MTESVFVGIVSRIDRQQMNLQEAFLATFEELLDVVKELCLTIQFTKTENQLIKIACASFENAMLTDSQAGQLPGSPVPPDSSGDRDI